MTRPSDPQTLRDRLQAGAYEYTRAPWLAEQGAALLGPLVAFAADGSEPLDLRIRAIDAVSELPADADAAVDALWGFLGDPGFFASVGNDDDALTLARRSGPALARLVGRGASLDRIRSGLTAGSLAVEYACAFALRDVLDGGDLAAPDVARVVASLTERIAPRDWFDGVTYEACFDALRAAGPAAEPAIPILVAALGVEITGERAAMALSEAGDSGRRALVGALAGCPPVQGAWSRPDWDTRDPRYDLVHFVGSFRADGVPVLIEAVAEGSMEQRYFVLRALEGMARAAPPMRPIVARHEPLFIAALADQDEYFGACFPAVELLRIVGTAAALPTLDALATSEDWEEARAAAAAIRARIAGSPPTP